MKLSTYIIFAIVIILLIALSVLCFYILNIYHDKCNGKFEIDNKDCLIDRLSFFSGFILSIFSLVAILILLVNIKDDYYEWKNKQKTNNLPQISESINLSEMVEKSKTE